MIQAKWCGIDFGQCLMEPTGLRTYLVLGDIYKELGKPEKIPDAVKKFRTIVEVYGGHSLLKESHRDKIHSYVFDGDDEAMELFGVKEKEYLSVGAGAVEAFIYLNEQGIDVNVVAELKKTLGAMGKDIVSRFLNGKNLMKYFNCMYTPQGKVNLRNGTIDESYKGKTKHGVRPDGFFTLIDHLRQINNQPAKARFLVEYDNSTHPLYRFGKHKALPGLNYIRSQDYKNRFGFNSGRWLVICKSETRLKHLKSQTEYVLGKQASNFLFSICSELNYKTVLTSPVWHLGASNSKESLVKNVGSMPE